jgi:uncharacterized circularly permuted ATP-grasp superfamily protein
MVLSSRADAPSGIGYALENRIVISNTFPDLFRDMQVERLASFFNAYREFVLDLAEQKRRDRTTKPISSMPISRTISGSRWSRDRTSSYATGKCC